MNNVRAIDSFGNIKRKSRPHKKSHSKFWFVFSILAIPIINFLIFYVYVNLDSFIMAFQNYGLVDGVNQAYFTLDNFKVIFDSFTGGGQLGGVMGTALINTLIFFAVNTFIVMPITIFLCFFFYKKITGYKFFRAILYLPCIIASSALVVLYKQVLKPGGTLAVLFGEGFVYPFAPDQPYNRAMLYIMIYNIVFGIGGNIIIISGAMNSIDKELLEAARIDGCRWFRQFTRIVIPSIWPTISTVIILSVAGILAASGPILAFDQGTHDTATLNFLLFALVGGVGNYGVAHGEYLASAIGLCMTIVSFPLALVVKRVLYGKE